MTPARAREILEAGKVSGEYRKHMTLEEEDQVYDIWSRIERSTSFREVLGMIARSEGTGAQSNLRVNTTEIV